MLRVRGSKPTVFLLAILLVLVQQIGYAHALSHFANPDAPRPARSDTQHLAEKVCVQCAVHAQLGSPLPSHGVSIPLVAIGYAQAAVEPHRIFLPASSPPFLSRAPPR